MPKICDNCRFFSVGRSLGERCHNFEVRTRVDPDFIAMRSYVELTPAREICNKEADGIFVYFQPQRPPRCPRCKGEGSHGMLTPLGTSTIRVECETCQGTGRTTA